MVMYLPKFDTNFIDYKKHGNNVINVEKNWITLLLVQLTIRFYIYETYIYNDKPKIMWQMLKFIVKSHIFLNCFSRIRYNKTSPHIFFNSTSIDIITHVNFHSSDPFEAPRKIHCHRIFYQWRIQSMFYARSSKFNWNFLNFSDKNR